MEADLIVSCPYNPAHRIRKYKLMSHISKCKKTSKMIDKTECPLDKTHIIDRDCLKEHIASCPSLGKLVVMNTGYDEPKMDVQPPIIMNSYDSTENWEEEPEVPPYDPMEVSSKKAVIRCMSGLTKSEKKKFKENERMRIANLKGFRSESAASSFVNDTIYEASLRRPRDPIVSPTRISQNNFNKNMQMQKHNDNDNDDHNASMQAKFVPEFHNNSFHRMLYDELAPEDDNIKQLEESLRNTDTKISLRDYFQHVSKENGNFSFSDQNQEIKVKKAETVTTSKLFNTDNRKKERDEYIANTSSVSNDRVTDNLLALLKNELSVKKVQRKEEIKIDQINKDSDEKGSALDEISSKLNERLAYLTEIQDAITKESARILEQLKELKLREENALKK